MVQEKPPSPIDLKLMLDQYSKTLSFGADIGWKSLTLLFAITATYYAFNKENIDKPKCVGELGLILAGFLLALWLYYCAFRRSMRRSAACVATLKRLMDEASLGSLETLGIVENEHKAVYRALFAMFVAVFLVVAILISRKTVEVLAYGQFECGPCLWGEPTLLKNGKCPPASNVYRRTANASGESLIIRSP